MRKQNENSEPVSLNHEEQQTKRGKQRSVLERESRTDAREKERERDVGNDRYYGSSGRDNVRSDLRSVRVIDLVYEDEQGGRYRHHGEYGYDGEQQDGEDGCVMLALTLKAVGGLSCVVVVVVVDGEGRARFLEP